MAEWKIFGGWMPGVSLRAGRASEVSKNEPAVGAGSPKASTTSATAGRRDEMHVDNTEAVIVTGKCADHHRHRGINGIS